MINRRIPFPSSALVLAELLKILCDVFNDSLKLTDSFFGSVNDLDFPSSFHLYLKIRNSFHKPQFWRQCYFLLFCKPDIKMSITREYCDFFKFFLYILIDKVAISQIIKTIGTLPFFFWASWLRHCHFVILYEPQMCLLMDRTQNQY